MCITRSLRWSGCWKRSGSMSDKLSFKRQSLRLPDHDYSGPGSYFITICTDQRVFHFGAIFNDMMIMNEIGRIARDEWDKLPMRFPHIVLGPVCVMPNHIHGIIQITEASSSPSPSLPFIND